jgi:hypothetical protein
MRAAGWRIAVINPEHVQRAAAHLQELAKLAGVDGLVDLGALYVGMLDRCLETMSMQQLQDMLEICSVTGSPCGAAVSEEIKKRLRAL